MATPPHPPPAANERATSTCLEGLLKHRVGPIFNKSVVWGAALAESAVILATYFPNWPASQKILDTLVFPEGSARRIKLTSLFFAGTFMAGLGGYIRYRCYRELGKFFTFEMSIRRNHELVTTGPYSIVRHPGYSGVLIGVAGIVMWNASPGSWARECGALATTGGKIVAGTFLTLVSTITAGLLLRMSKEDAALQDQFGEEWDVWARQVPCKLIPGVF
ncbi:hypothetical protein BD779DRAFT_1671269 [Infundibulicybe gibba]|nr:hypothetical protein BD779DRAFT_1671269 [Infundibulicybe gibba]